MPANRHPATRLAQALSRLFGGEAGAGLLLILAAVLAMLAANTALSGAYHALLHAPLPWTPIPKLETAHLWINDAVMAVFFFVVGLEIKRELLVGELSTPAQRRLPVLAAIGGMAVPALIYLGVAGGEPGLARGWAIPAATDIAFAVGVLALLGKRGPPALRLFLLTVAIVDDLVAVAIIAVFYTAQLKLAWLGAGLAVLAAMALLGRLRVERGWVYVLLAVAAWYCVLHSGVHATVAGVLAAFTIPLRLDHKGDSLLLRMEHALVPWSAYFVVPLFGFANAGVELSSGVSFGPLPLGIALGLLLGKPIGILGAILLAKRLRLAEPPPASAQQLAGMAMLCGIGFTMSLFIGALAFPSQQALIDEAKIGVLAGSLVSALCGFALLRFASGQR
ncbi:MAG: Na+/H+ antiporter NhaA [Novosphingobium sp.]|jgi:NhaA family Na+:H+ antiporter|uniref:Na+/H+ antiporter NhaA n=1 Tax=Novosphingobium sp. TaxID=1874826 RepID=UPI00391B3C60|nr:Na+/H+ antiporter NhaA [Novosphingobium sp.]